MPDDLKTVRDTPAAWEARSWTSRDGLNLFYRDYSGPSDRPPNLCLHGLPRNPRDFEEFANQFARRAPILFPAFCGRGVHDGCTAPPPTCQATLSAPVL